MLLDALTLAAVADELGSALPGARIEDIFQPTPQSVALECYGGGQKRWLLVSAHPQLARMHLLERKPRKLVAEPPAFVMLLRKHLEGARIAAVRQPEWERIVEIGFARTPPGAPPEVGVWLVVEAMGRLSNLILRDAAGTILGALHTVSGEVNAYRAIVPNVPYTPPPPQTRTLRGETIPKLDGETVTGGELREAAENALAHPATPKRGRKTQTPTVAGMLAATVLGFSRDLGAEVAARALADGDAPLDADVDWEAVAERTRELAALRQTHEWRPTLVYTDDNAAPTAFAVYTPVRFGGARLEAAASTNAMLAAYYEGAEWRGAVEAAKGDLRHLLRTLHERSTRKDETLRAELRALEDARRLRLEADVLLAFQTEVPRGATSYSAPNPFAAEGEPETLAIELDPRLTAVENANRRYDRYHKMQRAGSQIPPQIEANQLELARIEQLQTDLALAESLPEIAHVREEIAEAGYLRGGNLRDGRIGRLKVPKTGKSGKNGKSGKQGKGGKGAKGGQLGRREADGGAPMRLQSADGMTLLVGKNSRQNEAVTFREATSNDVWLHARGVPGAHVIVKSGGRPVPEATLRQAASLAAYYSQAREAGTVPVDYTQQRYVRHMKGGGPGMVIYEGERTLYAAPTDAN